MSNKAGPVQFLVGRVRGHFAQLRSPVCTLPGLVAHQVRQLHSSVPPGLGEGDRAGFEQAHQRGTGHPKQYGGLLGGQHRVDRCDRDRLASGPWRGGVTQDGADLFGQLHVGAVGQNQYEPVPGVGGDARRIQRRFRCGG